MSDHLSGPLTLARRFNACHYPKLFILNPKTGQTYTSLKTAWATACREAGVKGLRFHDLRPETHVCNTRGRLWGAVENGWKSPGSSSDSDNREVCSRY